MLKSSILVTIALSLVLLYAAASQDQAALPAGQGPKTYQQARTLASKTAGYKNLHRIGLALHGYHDLFGHFPPAILHGPDGETPYSWRVELLPVLKHYVDRVDPEKLQPAIAFDRRRYDALIADCGYDVSEPWDSQKNRTLINVIPEEYRHPDDQPDSTLCAFYAVVGDGSAFDPADKVSYDDIQGWPAWSLMVVESRKREPWTKPIDITYSVANPVPRFGGFTDDGFLALTADGAVHFISDTVPPADLRAFISRDPSDPFEIIGVPFRFPAQKETQKKESLVGKVQPDRLDFGDVRQAATIEGSVRIFAEGNDATGVATNVNPPPFVKVRSVELGAREFGRHGTVLTCDITLSVDTSRVGELSGQVTVEIGRQQAVFPVAANVLPQSDAATRVLVVETPFHNTSTDDADLFTPWLRVVQATGIDAHYWEVVPDQAVLRNADLSSFDVILLGTGGLFRLQEKDYEQLDKFVNKGGRLIVAANSFYVGTVERGNKLLALGGLEMSDEEFPLSEPFDMTGFQIRKHALTEDVELVTCRRASPIAVIDREKGSILVEAATYPGEAFVAVGRYGDGEIIGLGQSLWWGWISSPTYEGSDNQRLLQNLVSTRQPKPE